MNRHQANIVKEPRNIRTSVITTGVCPSGANCCNVPVTLNSRQLNNRKNGPLSERMKSEFQANFFNLNKMTFR